MKQWLAILLVGSCCCVGCKKEPGVAENVSDIFWLSNKGADMPVWVKGNTASKVIILFVHGGPGKGSYSYSGFQTDQLQKNYAVAYWDQRDAGAAQGNANYADLSLQQMIEDLEKLVDVLHHRYGNDTRIFLLGHSFGGLLGSGYLVKDNNQRNIKGWIEVDGAHDYPETNIYSRQMLMDTGRSEIAKGNYVKEWTEVVNYCESHPPNVSLDISYTTNAYAHKVEEYVNIEHRSNSIEIMSVSSPLMYGINLFMMYETSKGKNFLRSLEPVSFTSQLHQITIPSLLIWGKYDFVVPMATGQHAFHELGSSIKEFVVMPNSGHTPMNGNTTLFAATVAAFIEKVK